MPRSTRRARAGRRRANVRGAAPPSARAEPRPADAAGPAGSVPGDRAAGPAESGGAAGSAADAEEKPAPASPPADEARPRARVQSTGALSLEVIEGGGESVVHLGEEPLRGRYLMKELFD